MFQIFGDASPLQTHTPVALTFGNFDGVHQGHVHLIQTIRAQHPHLPCIAVTFFPHPQTYFHPSKPFPLLCSLNERVEKLLYAGAHTVVVQRFEKSFAHLSAEEFCNKWLCENFNPNVIYVGHDFRYGKNRLGNFDTLIKSGIQKGWQTFQVPPFYAGSEVISSSLIRKNLEAGSVEYAANLLGYEYQLSGTVIHGNKTGRELGFPTANLGGYEGHFIPRHGVYACHVKGITNNPLPAIMNCGIRPTIDGMRLQIEAHILNFNEDIYGKELSFSFLHFLRPEMKFASLQELKEQISSDVKQVTNFFAHARNDAGNF